VRPPAGRTDDPVEAIHVLVRGLVQGVSFRYHACGVARQAGAVGWVRNLPDGSVEAHVQGAAPVVADVLAWLRRGPAAARVEGLEATPAAVDATLTSFDTRR
jgi:acylphosphatase